MKKRNKIILTITVILSFTVISFIGYGLRLMAIEDHYGVDQELYFKSRNGDIIVNRDFKEVGKLEKNWTRIQIINKGNNSDLLEWAYENKVEVYRPERNIENVSNLTFDEVEKLISIKDLKLIIKN